MMSFLRKLTKPESEKRQELLTAYLDGRLSPKDAQLLEERLRRDSALQWELEQQRFVKESLAQLPRQKAPRNFTLDPALFGKPSPQYGLQFYPVLRGATVLALFVFIALVSIDALTPRAGTVASLTNADALTPSFEAAKEADAPLLQMVPEGEMAESSAFGDEVAALAPAMEAAVEEVVEVQAEVVVEEAEATEPAEEEPSGAQEGDGFFSTPAEVAAPQEESAVGEAAADDAQAAQNVAATEPAAGRIMDGAQETATIEAGEPPGTPAPEGTLARSTEAPLPAVDTAGAILAEEAPEFLEEEEPGIATVEPEERAEEALADAETGQLLGLSVLQIGEIFLGAVVVLMLFFTLLLRRRLR